MMKFLACNPIHHISNRNRYKQIVQPQISRQHPTCPGGEEFSTNKSSSPVRKWTF